VPTASLPLLDIGNRATIKGMAENLESLLDRFRRDIATHVDSGLADLRQQNVELRADLNAFRREMLSHLDEIYRRFDRLDTEYHALVAAVSRLEALPPDKAELQREIEHLRGRIHQLEQRLDDLERSAREN
jgi:chromosome segregation ATPase